MKASKKNRLPIFLLNGILRRRINNMCKEYINPFSYASKCLLTSIRRSFAGFGASTRILLNRPKSRLSVAGTWPREGAFALVNADKDISSVRRGKMSTCNPVKNWDVDLGGSRGKSYKFNQRL